jgi:hypothetical protein
MKINEKGLCRASKENARQRYMFAVRQRKTHGKDICLPCVLPQRTAKYFQKIVFCTSFNFSTSKTLFCTIHFNHMHVSINLLFLTIMCHLKNFCRICQI